MAVFKCNTIFIMIIFQNLMTKYKTVNEASFMIQDSTLNNISSLAVLNENFDLLRSCFVGVSTREKV